MCKLKFAFGVFMFLACNKKDPQNNSIVTNRQGTSQVVYPTSTLDAFSKINKTTSWYNTTIAMTSLFEVSKSRYWGFELIVNGGLVPLNTGTNNTQNGTRNFYWNDLGTYLYTDFTEDGKKDLWAYYLKYPWPTNAAGLHLFSEYVGSPNVYDLQSGLTQVRKCVVSDMDGDGKKDVMLFSSGLDAFPNPGDSLGIFYPKDLKYQYLNSDIGYYHGGATGDVNGDGLIDIVGYSGFSQLIPVHPTCYINNGKRSFTLNKNIFKNFTNQDNYYTVELFDINKDGSLDLFLGSIEKLIVITNKDGVFDRKNSINLPVDSKLEIMDIAFLDFDLDGNIDVLTMSNKGGYNGYALRLFLNKGDLFIESSKSYFDKTDEVGTKSWIKWIRILDYDVDGDLDVVADGLFGNLNGTGGKKIYWRNDGGKFIQVKVN